MFKPRKTPHKHSTKSVPSLPLEALGRIAIARIRAEEELKRELEPLEATTDWRDLQAPYSKFVLALFRAEAKELVRIIGSERDLHRALAIVADRIVDEVLPPGELVLRDKLGWRILQ